MKLNLSLFIVTICFLFSFNTSKAQTGTFDTEAISMLRKFYNGYIAIGLKESKDGSFVASEALLKANTTEKLFNAIKNLDNEFDSDPIIKAQEVSPDWLKTMTINKNSKILHGFIVRYIDFYSFEPLEIYLHVTKVSSGKYLIDNIYATPSGKSVIF